MGVKGRPRGRPCGRGGQRGLPGGGNCRTGNLQAGGARIGLAREKDAARPGPPLPPPLLPLPAPAPRAAGQCSVRSNLFWAVPRCRRGWIPAFSSCSTSSEGS